VCRTCNADVQWLCQQDAFIADAKELRGSKMEDIAQSELFAYSCNTLGTPGEGRQGDTAVRATWPAASFNNQHGCCVCCDLQTDQHHTA